MPLIVKEFTNSLFTYLRTMENMKKITGILFCSIIGLASFAQSLSATEQKIVQYIQSHQKEAEQLLETTVNINSGSLNIAGVKKVGASFAKALEQAGFKTEWVPVPDSLKRAGHLWPLETAEWAKGFF